MKYCLIALLMICQTAISQITINNVDVGDAGDATWVSTAQDVSIDFASTGANHSWDYSSLSSTGQELKSYNDLSGVSFLVEFMFGIFAGSDYQATNYTPSTALPLDQLGGILPVNITDINQFSKHSNDSITSIGLSLVIEGNEVPVKSDVIETRYKFPLTYGDSYVSNGYTNLDMNPIYNGIWRQYRTRTTNVDGWGSITTPYGTFDAIRVHHMIEESDSLFIDLFGTGTWIPLPIPESHQYEWWANGEKEPVLRITTTSIGGNETVTNIEYKDNEIVGVEESSLSEVAFYPNPVFDHLTIEALKNKSKFIVFDINGRNVLEGIVEPGNSQINTSQLTIGKYTILVLSDDEQLKSSFLKK